MKRRHTNKSSHIPVEFGDTGPIAAQTNTDEFCVVAEYQTPDNVYKCQALLQRERHDTNGTNDDPINFSVRRELQNWRR